MLKVKDIDAIFQKGDGDDYKNKSRMYQDILIFGSTIQENEEFKLWDLARYLLYNNEELRDHYFKSELRKRKLTENSKIENIQRRVKRNVNDLVVLRIMAKVRLVKEEGTGLIPTFRFTTFGYFISQIIQSLQSDINVDTKLYDLFHESLFKVQTTSRTFVIFASNWIKKMHEKGVFVHYVSILKKDSKFLNDIWDLNEFI